jgi:hypothetical protein
MPYYGIIAITNGNQSETNRPEGYNDFAPTWDAKKSKADRCERTKVTLISGSCVDRQRNQGGGEVMSAARQSVRPNLSTAGADSVLNAAEVATLLGYKPGTAQKWITRNAARLNAWKTGEVAGQWRVKLGNLRQACKQLGKSI